jgi:hypothetical protein
VGDSGAPGEIRTPDLQLRRLPLYPAELRARNLSLHRSVAAIQFDEGRIVGRNSPQSARRAKCASPKGMGSAKTADCEQLSASAIAPPAAGTFCLWPRFVYVDGASAELRSIQTGNRLFSFFGIGHFHETESARSSGLAIRQNTYAVHLAIGLKELAQLILRRIETEIPDEDVFQGALFSVFANQGEHSSKQKAVLPGPASAP